MHSLVCIMELLRYLWLYVAVVCFNSVDVLCYCFVFLHVGCDLLFD